MPSDTTRGHGLLSKNFFSVRYRKLCTAQGAFARSRVSVMAPRSVAIWTGTVPVAGVFAGSAGRPTSLASGLASDSAVSVYLHGPLVAFGARLGVALALALGVPWAAGVVSSPPSWVTSRKTAPSTTATPIEAA